LRFDGTLSEVRSVLNGTASVIGLGNVGRLAGWGWRVRGRGSGRGRGRAATGLIRTVGDADASISPDVIASQEGVSSMNGTRLKIELILNRGASISGLGGIRRLASRRWCGLGRPRSTTEPGAVACAVTTDEIICGKIGTLSSCEEREAPVGKGVDGSTVEGSVSRRLECLVREREMGAGIWLIKGEIKVEVDRALLVSAL
jgi:hypothetical protein